MKADIVFPDGNESDFLAMAKKMGFDALCFVYEKDSSISDTKYNADIPNLHILRALKKPKVGYLYFSDDLSAFNKKNVDLIYGLEVLEKKDSLREIKSGLNQVLCKSAAKNDIKYGFSLRHIFEAKDRKLILARIMQNIKLCRKYKVEMVLGSFATKPEEMRAYHDLVAFGIVLGMHPTEAKKALGFS